MATNYRYFATQDGQPVELTNVFHDKGKFRGLPVGTVQTYSKEAGWFGQYVAAERVIEFKKNPSRHECDARCLNATGRVMKCECSCGGKNHGRGSLVCEEAA